MPTRRFSGYTLRVRREGGREGVYTKPSSGHCVTGLYHRNALSSNLLTYEIA